MLIVFSGLPGTGKTTIASGIAARLRAVYLRIDVVEQAMRDEGFTSQQLGRSGYTIANALALSNLRCGGTVVADCVNPVIESRLAWAEVAKSAGVALLNIHVFCSDSREHRRRVEERQGDIVGLLPPTWQSVLNHQYDEWDGSVLRLDTALMSPASAIEFIIQKAFSGVQPKH